MHGDFVLREQQFLDAAGNVTSYLRLSGQSRVSVGLQEFCLFFCTRASYDTVVALVERITGSHLVCAQTLSNWVERKAQQIEADLVETVAQTREMPMPAIAERIDLYDPQAEEVLVLCDGICVKAQNPVHVKAGEPRPPKPQKRHDTDVMLLQAQDGSFRYLTGSSDQRVSLPEVASAYLRREWAERLTPLPLLALTDGAQKIRQDLASAFGVRVTLILDWYHLAQRVYQNLSMAAHTTAERAAWEGTVLGALWRGRVPEALSFLSGIAPRNPKALSDLQGYLHKHTGEIIDYARRQATGKPIGSGRMEKAVDQVIGIRQKKKSMSWSRVGSHALALLKIAELNGLWQRLWVNAPLAA